MSLFDSTTKDQKTAEAMNEAEARIVKPLMTLVDHYRAILATNPPNPVALHENIATVHGLLADIAHSKDRRGARVEAPKVSRP